MKRLLVCVLLAGLTPFVAANFVLADQPELKARVFAEYPKLDPQHPQHEQLDDWDVVCMLREFSYRHTCYSNSVSSRSYLAGAAVVDELLAGKRTLGNVYEFFDNGGGGVICGHTAHLLQRLYTEFGYRAWYAGHGFSPPTPRGSRFTHAETLVQIEVGDDGNRRHILTLHDPNTNISYVDAETKTPLDYFEMLDRLVRRRAATITTRGAIEDGIHREYPFTICFSDETSGRQPDYFKASWNVGLKSKWIDLGDNTWKFTGPRQVASFERLGDSWWKKELVAEGMPSQTIYLHCFPFQVSGGPNAAEILKKARTIVRQDDRPNEE